MSKRDEERDGYNGYTNYETWCVALWMDNEQGTHDYWRERAQAAWDEAETGGNRFADTRIARARILLVEWLKDEWDDGADVGVTIGGRKVEACVYTDLLNAALSEVDWYEIAGNLLDEAEYEEAASCAT